MFALGCHLIVVLAPLPARAEPKLWGLQHPWPFRKEPSPARAGPSALLIGLEACAQLRHQYLELREGLGELAQRVLIARPREVFILLVVGALIANKVLCLLYTSPSPRDATLSRMPSSA